MPHLLTYAYYVYLVGSQLYSNGLELSRPARYLACFPRFPYQVTCKHIALSTGSAPASQPRARET